MEEEIKNKLKELVDEKRYVHSLLVADEAKKLARIYDVSEDRAYLTGLCHDIAKDFTYEDNKKWISKYNLDTSLLNADYKKMIHADVGALVAKEWFNFDDEMCSAIKYHTICHHTMTTFEKIIFLADKIGRVNLTNTMQEIKNIAYKDLDKAVVMFLEEEQIYLKSKGLDIHSEAKRLLASLK